MRASKLLAGWVLCAAAWAACGGEKTVTQKGLGFEITFPESYEPGRARVGKDRYVSALASDPKVWVDVIVHDVEGDNTLSSFFTNPLYGPALMSGTTLAAVNLVELNGVRALKLEADDVPDGEHRLVCFAVIGKREYCMRIIGKKAAFEKRREEIDAIVASFKIIEAK